MIVQYFRIWLFTDISLQPCWELLKARRFVCAIGSRFHRTQQLKVSRWKQHLQCFKGPGQWHRVGLLLTLHHHDVPHDNPIHPIHECWAPWPLGFGQWAHGEHDDQDQNKRRVRILRKHQRPKHPKHPRRRWQVLRNRMLSFWQNFENEFRHVRPKTAVWGWDDEMICSTNSYNWWLFHFRCWSFFEFLTLACVIDVALSRGSSSCVFSLVCQGSCDF